MCISEVEYFTLITYVKLQIKSESCLILIDLFSILDNLLEHSTDLDTRTAFLHMKVIKHQGI